ncbi:hypothetical protein B0H14DRAFT_2602821 [Mycena olivaceomarginata]|nr:hypothetical protein B0H14DRAFT_2602821 [Mycena olivaceomarginata]
MNLGTRGTQPYVTDEERSKKATTDKYKAQLTRLLFGFLALFEQNIRHSPNMRLGGFESAKSEQCCVHRRWRLVLRWEEVWSFARSREIRVVAMKAVGVNGKLGRAPPEGDGSKESIPPAFQSPKSYRADVGVHREIPTVVGKVRKNQLHVSIELKITRQKIIIGRGGSERVVVDRSAEGLGHVRRKLEVVEPRQVAAEAEL